MKATAPIKKEFSAEQRSGAIRRIQELSIWLRLGELSIKDMIDEGRRIFVREPPNAIPG